MPADMTIPDARTSVRRRVRAAADRLERVAPRLVIEEHGEVRSVSEGIAEFTGLPGVQSEELVRLGRGVPALALDLREDHVGVALLDARGDLAPGDPVRRTGRVLDVPVGRALLGRVVDALGRPLDDRSAPRTSERWPVEREAPAIMDRAPVTVPLETGLKVVDALIPIGRGQRQLIVGDRQIGKTAIAVDTIINQRDTGVACIYCAIGQRAASTAGTIADLRERSGMEHVVVVATSEEDPPGLRFIAPYAAMSMAEWFMEQGEDALLVLDDLSHHARAYRELSLLLRRPPGREAYPGDIFYIHSRLLERSTHLRSERGGGSLTALPIVQTEAQNISAYIPTNLISITDGQIYLSPQLFQEGVLPAVDVGRSVSRVGGKTQFPAYRDVAGDLRLAYSQFEELESFSRFASRLDEETRATLEHGRRIRVILKQDQYDPMPVLEQVALLLAVSEGLMDEVDPDAVEDLAADIRARVRERHAELEDAIRGDEPLDESQRGQLLDAARAVIDEHGAADASRDTDGDKEIAADRRSRARRDDEEDVMQDAEDGEADADRTDADDADDDGAGTAAETEDERSGGS